MVVEHKQCDFKTYDSDSGKYSCACGRSNAQKTVWYQEYNTQTGKFEKKACDAYAVIVEHTLTDVSCSDAWLVVEGEKVVAGELSFEQDTNLILCDGATLAVHDGIHTNGNLTIYGGEQGTGKLVVTRNSDDGSCVAMDMNGYDLTVHGGNIAATAETATSSYGIKVKSFTVYGGTVTATGGTTSEGSSYGIHVNRKLTVSGGTVTATGNKAADESRGILANNATVSGGTLKLTEGSYMTESLTVTASVTLADLLSDGCAYQLDGSDAPSKLSDLTSPLTVGVYVVTHDHDYESGKCVYCGKTKPSSGGGGGGSASNTTSTTVKNEDGSTTTTTTDKKTGEVTETTKDTNGVTGTTVTDKNGNVTDVSANIPASATKDGETVTLPIEEVKHENGTEIKIDVPKGGATIEIPVENPTPDTVVVIVDKDGNETIIPGSKVTENGIEVTLTEDATIKVIRNGKTFADVKESDYFYDAVLWASARNITGGIGNNLFGPHDSCTRAQLVTFLWRAAGCPAAEYEMNFSDVGSSYYTETVAWAVENGIVGGYDNGLFGSEDPITREQMAVILYRFAQKTGMDTTQGGMAVREYKDFDNISAYAVATIQWAVNAGIMQGYDGNLMPDQPCTRAQIVTMLYRLLGTN